MTDNNTVSPQRDEEQTQNTTLDATPASVVDEQEDTPMAEPESPEPTPSEPDAKSPEEEDDPEPVDDTTELHTAAQNIDLAHMRKILEPGSSPSSQLLNTDINAKTSENGHTPLWDLVSAAVEWDEIHEDAIACLKLLIAHGADVNAQSKNGATPLHRCAFSWCHDTSVEIARVLLEHGADPNANKTIKPPPAVVVESTQTPAATTTSHTHNDNDHEDDGCECGGHVGTLLKAAYKQATGHQLPAPVTSESPPRPHEPLVNPVHLAVGRNANLPMLKLLLSNGAAPSLTINDPDAATPLHLAVSAGSETKHLEIITFLLSQLDQHQISSLLSTPDAKGYLPIHLAAESYSPSTPTRDSKSHEIITALLDTGSPVDPPIPDTHPREHRRGLTPLLLVAQNSQLPNNQPENEEEDPENNNPPLKTIKTLISRGADPTIQAGLSQSALLLSIMSQNLPLVRYLSTRPGIDIASLSTSPSTILKPLSAACISTHPSLVRFLVTEARCPVDERDEDGYTALIQTAGYAKDPSRAAETIRTLVVDLGADIEAQIRDGRRAIHFASFKGQPEAARELVRLGCDIHAVDENGWTALHFAGRYHHPEVVKILLDDDGDESQGKARGFKDLIGRVVSGGPQPQLKDGEEIDIVGFNAADLARTVRNGQETVDVLVERGEVLSERTRDLTDEDLWEEEKRSCTVM